MEGGGEGEVEGLVEGAPEGFFEGVTEGSVEGGAEGITEGSIEGNTEGIVEGAIEGATEGVPLDPEEFISIPAGTFEMGRPYRNIDSSAQNEVPVHDVYLDAYAIGKYEVTNQQMADVLNWAYDQGYLYNRNGVSYTGGAVGVYAHGEYLMSTYADWEDSSIEFSAGKFTVQSRTGYGGQSFDMSSHPANLVSWYGCVAYCNWRSEMEGLDSCYNFTGWSRYAPVRNGYRLPTEAEWERAAAWDGDRHWRYGFSSDTISAARANYSLEFSLNPLGLTTDPKTSPVGWFNGVNVSPNGNVQTQDSRSPVGAYDMSGNLEEWCHDWYSWGYYATSPGSNPEGGAFPHTRVVRGGAYYSGQKATRAAYREGRQENYGYGLRVARTP
jgi:formylglycine-generating enzyme required for sulfatase activity